jgi:hypothetical protein
VSDSDEVKKIVRDLSREDFLREWEAVKKRLSPYMRKLAEGRKETQRFVSQCSCPHTCFFHTRMM